MYGLQNLQDGIKEKFKKEKPVIRVTTLLGQKTISIKILEIFQKICIPIILA